MNLNIFIFTSLIFFELSLFNIEASPLFFVNFFPSPTPVLDKETENISVYTTTPKNASDSQITTETPTVYQQIAQNILEKVASQFIIPVANRLLSTTKKPGHTQLEIVDDSLEIEDSNEVYDKEDEVEDKELIDPKFIDSNPSFKVIPKGRQKPERLTNPPSLEEYDDDLSESTTENGFKRDMTENGVVRILEVIASVITIVGGAVTAFLRPAMDM